jgi:hypothetical protein
MLEVLFGWILAAFWWGHAMLSPVIDGRSAEWRIMHTEWSETHERAYQDFVQRIGESDCRNVHECLTGPGNTYRHNDPPGIWFQADCADLPYLLRAYFAWKNGLPFSHVNGVRPVTGGGDIRYTPRGNIPTSRRDAVNQEGQRRINAVQFFREMRNMTNTAMLRIHPEHDGRVPNDHYSPALEPGAIRPGTLIYDPNGHAAIVYRVEDDGRIRYMDAHPDNTLTRGTYGPHFYRGNPGIAGGFKNWRPKRLVGARRSESGEYFGGRVQLADNESIADFALTQFYGTEGGVGRSNWQEARFVYDGEEMDFYDYVRAAMAGENLVFNPLEEMRNSLIELCQDLGYRVDAVHQAIRAGLDRRRPPSRLPDNIYGTHGDWEVYSTPARDARLRMTFVNARNNVEQLVTRYYMNDERVQYDGDDLPNDLLRAYDEKAQSCRISYRRTDGSTVELTYQQVVDRLFDLSFDPYHCVERRWGASGDELSTCRDDEVKTAWYEAQRYLRYQHVRDYDVFMGYTLSQLQERGPGPGTGAPEPPDVDLRGYIKSLTAPTG